MSGKQNKPHKHIPQRTCVGCHSVLPKRSLLRLVRQGEYVLVDPTGKLAGRGAYLHNIRSCWKKGLRGSLAHALKVNLSPENLNLLQQYYEALPEEES